MIYLTGGKKLQDMNIFKRNLSLAFSHTLHETRTFFPPFSAEDKKSSKWHATKEVVVHALQLKTCAARVGGSLIG